MKEGAGWCIIFMIISIFVITFLMWVHKLVKLAEQDLAPGASKKSGFCSPCALGRRCHSCGKYGGGCGCSFYGTELGMIPKYVLVGEVFYAEVC